MDLEFSRVLAEMIFVQPATPSLFALIKTKSGFLITPVAQETQVELEATHPGLFFGWYATRQEAEAEREHLEAQYRFIAGT